MGGRVVEVRVLVIEDNVDLAANVVDFLTARGMIVDAAGDGVTGLHLAVTEPVDVVVLDLALPGMDGLDVCRKLRREARRATPVLMLTARDTLDEKLAGFEAGADDYLVKPFALKELEARVRALAKRARQATSTGVLSVGDLTLDAERYEVRRAGVPVKLPRTCVRILEMLMAAAGRVVTRRELEEEIWGDDPPASDPLRAHVHTLRAAVDHPFDRPLIHTVHGVGYKLEDAGEG